MTNKEQYNLVRQRIIDACPELKPVIEVEQKTENIGDFVIQSQQPTGIVNELPILIGDILLALPGNRAYFVDSSGIFYKSHLSKGTYECLSIKWILAKPLPEQKPDTIEFLFNILK